MNLSLYIAKRYLISKKSHNVINIISGISAIGITIGTMALIIVLSVFNGFEELITSMFNSFSPDLLITPVTGKTISKDNFPESYIKNIDGVLFYNEVVEENVLIRYENKQHIANLKGVSDDYLKMNTLKEHMTEGEAIIRHNGIDFIIIGAGISYYLDFLKNASGKSLNIFAPQRKQGYNLNFDDVFNHRNIIISGVFSLEQEFDNKYIITNIDFAKQIFGYDQEISSVEIGISENTDVERVKEKIVQILGKNFNVENRFEQQELLYKIMKSEKWAIFLILTFILIIAAFNVIGSLSMLILDKKKDIKVLQSMGANLGLIKKIFLFEGALISVLGAFLGLLLGSLICWLQLQFGLIHLGDADGSFIVDTYPVKIELFDFISVFVTVCTLGMIAVWIPVHQVSKKYLNLKLE